MYNHLKLSWKRQNEFYRNFGFLDFFSLFFIHIFIAWNGIQFLLFPLHFDYIIDTISIFQNYEIVEKTQSVYVPLYIFCIVTGLILFIFIRNYMEIEFNNIFHKKKTSFKDQFIHLVNFSIPAISHSFFVVFVLATAYLFLLILYFLLLSFGIGIPLNLHWVVKFSFLYFCIGVICYNIITTDFVLPELLKSKTYTEAINKFYAYFKENKLKFFFFYTFKFCCISINILILIYFLHYFVPRSFIILPQTVGLQSSLVLIVTLFSGVMLSLLINSFIIQFLSVFCYSLFSVLFKDYSEFD